MKKLLLITFGFLILNYTSAQTWSAVGSGIGNFFTGPAIIRALAEYNGELYAAGTIDTAGGIPANNIARWNGTSWDSVVSGLDDQVLSLAVYNNELYAGGFFTHAGGIPANHIAKWNGTSWDSLSSSLEGTVFALAVYNGELYAAGAFYYAGSIVSPGVAKWNGTLWSAVTSTINGSIFTLAVFNSQLYAGGYLSSINGIPANAIAKWDGLTWSAVGSGMHLHSGPPDIEALATFSGELYAAGQFDTAGGMPASNIAKWDGLSWSVVGSGVDNRVAAFAVYNNELYTGGTFMHAGGAPANFIAKWNGANWSALGTGLGYFTYALAVYNNELYAAGTFPTAGGIAVNNIARWNSPVSIENLSSSNSTNIFPNPTHEIITIESKTLNNLLELYDAVGNLLMKTSYNSYKLELDMSKLAKGIYFITIHEDGKQFHKKVVKE